MRRSRLHRTTTTWLLLILLGAAPTAWSASITGTIQSQDGKPMEGVVVSARQEGRTITTNVFTDEQGRYVFPPMDGGKYSLWAQAIGFETARVDLTLSAAPAQRDFTMKPLADFTRQLSSSEFMAALPQDTPANQRMKMAFRNNCAGCHQPSFVLQNRFDEAGWKKIITLMERVGIYGDAPEMDQPPMPLLRYFKDDLAAYLAKVRGPASTLQFTPIPRPRGEAAQVVITEYDITSNIDPTWFTTADGSDWMEGTPSAYENRGPHDAEVAPDGAVWIADSQANKVRTVSRLDPQTGEMKSFKLDGRRGLARRSHGIVIDQKGVAWFNADNGLGKVDTKTEKVEWFEPPKGMPGVGGTLDVDNNGIVWMSTTEGALAFDPATNKFKQFTSLSRGNMGRSYGVAADADGNGWWAEMNYDKMGVGNYRTGEIGEVPMMRRNDVDKFMTAQDRKVFEFVGADWNSAPFWTQAPRRLGADKKGNTVWVANWWGDNLAKIDIKTRKVTYYSPPRPEAFEGVYDTVIDKNGMVWMNLMNADRIARFDPKTEKWAEFMLPSRGTETRFIAVDNRTDPVEVWVPYWRTSRIARIQFRTREQLQAQR
jgi:streptogramin lyase